MANSYSQFSEMIENLTKKERDWLKEVLETDWLNKTSDQQDRLLECLPQLPYSFDFDNYPGFKYDLNRKDTNFWIYCEEGYNEENLCNIIFAFIKKFRPEYIFSISIASFCDELRIKEFGGAWLVISSEGVRGGNTWGAAEEEEEKIMKARKMEGFGPTIRRAPKKRDGK